MSQGNDKQAEDEPSISPEAAELHTRISALEGKKGRWGADECLCDF